MGRPGEPVGKIGLNWTLKDKGSYDKDADGEKSRRKETQANTQRQGGVVWLVWYVCWKAGVMVPWGGREHSSEADYKGS